METQRIRELALQFRCAIESIPPEDRPIGMQSFPAGACGDTSLLFGAYLVDQGFTGFKYICGERGSKADNSWTSHAWLVHGTLVADLTADQFSDAPAPVIVSNPSPWHIQFDVDREQESDFRKWNDFGADILRPMYARILKELQA